MARGEELATLPFTYSAGTIRMSAWGGETGTRFLGLETVSWD